jgi:hypothetical protein
VVVSGLWAGLVPGLLAGENGTETMEEVRSIADEAQRVAEEIREAFSSWSEGRSETTTYMGIVIESVPDVLRDYIDLPRGVGLLLSHVRDDGPAAKAGLQDNDILVTFAGQKVINFNQLSTLIELEGAGAEVPVTVIRKGAEIEATVLLEERLRSGGRFLPSPPGAPAPPAPPEAPAVPNPDEVGRWVERIEEWIPGSVQIFVDENEQVHVDLEDLKSDLNELRVRLTRLQGMEEVQEVVREYGDLGARTSVVHAADRDIHYSGPLGRLVLNASEAGQQAMIWNADGQLIFEGPLPENYREVLPEAAVRLLDTLEASRERLQLESTDEMEIHLNAEALDPVTFRYSFSTEGGPDSF